MTATAATGREPVHVSAPLLVVATFYCTPRRGAPYFEVHLAPREINSSPRGLLVAHSHLCSCVVLQTRELAVYQDALDAEGTEHRVVATFHREGAVRVLDSLDVTP